MKRGTPGHPKTLALADELNIPIAYAVGLLEMLWHYTGDYTPRGDIGKVSNKAIARAVCWDGDADKLVSALVSTGWVDESDDHRLIIHDWPEHAEELVRKRLERMDGISGFLPEYGVSGIRRSAAENGGQSPTTSASRGARLGSDVDVESASSVEESPRETTPAQLQKSFLSRYKRTRGAKLDARKQDKPRTIAWLNDHRDAPDTILAALDRFLADEYWAGQGFPLAAFRKQYDSYREEVPAEEAAQPEPEPEIPEPSVAVVPIRTPMSDPRFQEFIRIAPDIGNRTLSKQEAEAAWDNRGNPRLEPFCWVHLDERQIDGAIRHYRVYCEQRKHEPKWIKSPLNFLKTEPWEAIIVPTPPPAPPRSMSIGERNQQEAMRLAGLL